MVIPAASRLKNVDWATQTVLFCWSSQGIWPAEVDGTEVIPNMAMFLPLYKLYSIPFGRWLLLVRMTRGKTSASPAGVSGSFHTMSPWYRMI